MTEFARIKDSVRTFGGNVWEVAEAEMKSPNGVLLVEPASGHWLYFTNEEIVMV